MRQWLRNGDRCSGQAILVVVLTCFLCGAQQEPAATAAEPAKPAADATQPATVPAPAVVQPDAGKAAPAAALPEPVAHPQAGTVTANILVVRARPAPHYERIGQFARGDQVTIVGSNADWYEVRVPADTRAWIAAQYLDAVGIVTADQVRLHSGPGLVFTTFCSARQGTRLDVLGPPVDGWQQVRAPADASAWISRAYVRVADPEPPVATATVAPPAETPAPAEPKAEVPTAATAVAVPADAEGETLVMTVTATPPPAEPKPEVPAAEPRDEAPTLTVTVVTPPAETTPETPAAETTPEAVVMAVPATPAPAEPKAETPAAEPEGETLVMTATPPAATPAPAEPKAETPRVEIVAAPTVGETAPLPVSAPPEAPAVTPAVPEGVATPTTPAQDAPVTMKEGVLLSLKSQASELASHVLCMRVGTTAYPICYLKSARLDLTEWENREVRVYGRELRLPGWSLAVLHVHSIQVNLKQ